MKLTRRSFLKASAATGALAALSGGVMSFERWAAKAAETGDVKLVPSICEMCGTKCGIIVKVKNGRVVKIEGNKEHPNGKGKICARGNAGMKLLYDPDRLKQPLKKEGDKFVPISWEQAFKEIGEKLKEIKAKYGPEALVWSTHPELAYDYEVIFNLAFGSPNLTSHAPTCYSPRNVAYKAMYGEVPTVDYGNVKYYISCGRNLVEGINVSQVLGIMKAKEKGAKLIALDPRYSNFAALASEWVPIRPGTDLAFLLAMIHLIIKNEWYDKEFVKNYTIGFEEVAAEVEKYTPKWAEEITGIPAATIERITEEFAKAKPAAVVDPGWHVSRYMNSTEMLRAGAVINALMGNLGMKGGLKFPKYKFTKVEEREGLWPKLEKPKAKRFDGAGGEKWPLAKGLGMIQMLPEHILSGQPYPIKAYIANHHNPVRSAGNSEKWIEALKQLELVVVIDVQMSETAMMAHYVLPESTYLERFDPPQIAGNAVALRQPAVEPLHNTMGVDDIIKELAHEAGIGQYFNFTLEQFSDQMLKPFNITFKQLMEKGVIALDDGKTEYKVPEIKTDSGKIELASGAFEKAGAKRVPTWKPPGVTEGNGKLRFLHGHTAVHTHTSTFNNEYLHALMPENVLWINTRTAEKLGIKNGDLVEVKSDYGKVTIKAKVTEAIHPDAVYMVHGFGGFSPYQKKAYKKGASTSFIIPCHVEPVSGAAADCEVLVEVRKVGGGANA
ncbi:molybdopterin oxidoreductase [Carboxydothermus islandicus]|uniref:Molybdopterin oxidoreductase n=1 Tax=Carboxydothermus islandicus TaxID=661089 RepID=A0A1L8CZ08_9THEO|nr:molybdopterin-dependent oxidoreductase [Carboxydothermus islandicus]GAV24165.1 molybdopterin oxidoreductase [Carboxydothermus islandicus]